MFARATLFSLLVSAWGDTAVIDSALQSEINVTPPMLSAASTLCSFVVSKRRWNWRRVTKNLKAG